MSHMDPRIAAKRKVLGELRDYLRAGTIREVKAKYDPKPKPEVSAQAPIETPAPDPTPEDLELALSHLSPPATQ